MNKQEIIDFVKNNTYFDLNSDEHEDLLIFTTRENGCVASETASPIDVAEAERMYHLLIKNFKDIDVHYEEVDEWVDINVKKHKELKPYYNYTFHKMDEKGAGFSESFTTMDALIKRFHDWIEVDWSELTEQMEAVNTFPRDRFNGWKDSNKILIKKAGEEGNQWGYSFYLSKSVTMK